MLSQLISSLISNTISGIVTTFKGVKAVRFYFIAVLTFLLIVGYMYKESIDMAAQVAFFNQVKFRECRDVIGLQEAFDKILKKDTVVDKYALYLYQPVNNSFYKKIVVTNSTNIMKSPALQGIYLKDQPTLNQELRLHDYYLIDERESITHEDLKYIAQLSPQPCLFYALKVDNKIVGEIAIRFKSTPSIPQIEDVLKDISPLLYNYVL